MALLEVLLAVALFVAAAAVMTVALNASLSSLNRQRLSLQAANLASSVLAEVQLGIRPLETTGRVTMEPPFAEWSMEMVVTPTESAGGESTGQARVEVIIRHQTESSVQRLAQVMPLQRGGTSTPASPAATSTASASIPEN